LYAPFVQNLGILTGINYKSTHHWENPTQVLKDPIDVYTALMFKVENGWILTRTNQQDSSKMRSPDCCSADFGSHLGFLGYHHHCKKNILVTVRRVVSSSHHKATSLDTFVNWGQLLFSWNLLQTFCHKKQALFICPKAKPFKNQGSYTIISYQIKSTTWVSVAPV
jgi:hypothetical protein